MDKLKIVIICGTGSSLSSGYIERLVAAGKDVFDIEVMDVKDTLVCGREPDLMVWDELQIMDFASIEQRVLASYMHPQLEQIPLKRYKEPLPYTFGVENVPADQRKGPKGPRGKWGKLK